MYVCLCKAITDKDVLEAIDAGAQSAEELSDQLGVGTGCGCCQEMTVELVNQHLAESQSYAV